MQTWRCTHKTCGYTTRLHDGVKEASHTHKNTKKTYPMKKEQS